MLLAAFGYFLLIFTGVGLGLTGAGGGIFMIPIFTLFFQIPLQTATLYSLTLLGSTALIGAWRERKWIHWKAVSIIAPFSGAAVSFTRSKILPSLPSHFLGYPMDQWLKLLFILLMIRSGYELIYNNQKDRLQRDDVIEKAGVLRLIASSLLLGLMVGLIGAGGGFLLIPLLVVGMKLSMQQATSSSLMIIGFNGMMGMLSHYKEIFDDHWQDVIPFLFCCLLGLLIGLKMKCHFSPAKLKKLFGYLVEGTAMIMIIDLILKLTQSVDQA